MAYFTYQGKAIYYETYGQGLPLVFLHGNTASAKMFEMLLPLYTPSFQCIVLDFLGNGRSERVAKFSPDLWYEQAWQVIALLDYLQVEKASLLGTSGGAWAALNAALERPDLFRAVIADSFDGRTLNDNFAENLLRERTMAKADESSRQFYAWCQGEDWETVIDQDTEALVQCAKEKRPLFHKPLAEINVPVLLTGSYEDTMCRANLEQEYQAMQALMMRADIWMFAHGGHPAVATNAELFAKKVMEFLSSK